MEQQQDPDDCTENEQEGGQEVVKETQWRMQGQVETMAVVRQV